MNGPGEDRLVIVGGGLAGCLAALALAKLRPEVPILILEAAEAFGGNHLWSFFDPDMDQENRWLVEPFIVGRWDSYDVIFPSRRRTLFTGYSSAGSAQLDRHVRDQLRPDQYRLGVQVAKVTLRSVELSSGEIIHARGVIDARGFPTLPEHQRSALDLAWQKFVGRDLHVTGGHSLERPIVMDATVEQKDGYRFVYSLPFDAEHLLVEDTYYSDSAMLDVGEVGARLDSYAKLRQWDRASIQRSEKGVLPVAMGGAFDTFWPVDDGARIGVMGGFFQPTTGYSLPDAVRTARLISRQQDLSGEGLARSLRQASLRLWKERRFYRLLNRMLFRAALPGDRYRVLEHFYRLDAELIGRFYAARLRPLDKIRILSGKPPVPIGRALAAMWNRT